MRISSSAKTNHAAAQAVSAASAARNDLTFLGLATILTCTTFYSNRRALESTNRYHAT